MGYVADQSNSNVLVDEGLTVNLQDSEGHLSTLTLTLTLTLEDTDW